MRVPGVQNGGDQPGHHAARHRKHTGNTAKTRQKHQFIARFLEDTQATEALIPSVLDKSAPTSTAHTSPAAENSFSATIDGHPFTIDQSTVSCALEGGSKSISAESADAEEKPIYFMMILDRKDHVDTITTSRGHDQGNVYRFEYMLRFTEASRTAHAEATVEGSTYTVTGEAPASDTTADSAPLKAFDMTVTCSRMATPSPL